MACASNITLYDLSENQLSDYLLRACLNWLRTFQNPDTGASITVYAYTWYTINLKLIFNSQALQIASLVWNLCRLCRSNSSGKLLLRDRCCKLTNNSLSILQRVVCREATKPLNDPLSMCS